MKPWARDHAHRGSGRTSVSPETATVIRVDFAAVRDAKHDDEEEGGSAKQLYCRRRTTRGGGGMLAGDCCNTSPWSQA